MFSQNRAVGNKVICSYYLKGTCKYGTRCWNIHPQNQGGVGMANTYATGATGTGGNVFGAKTTNQQDSKEFQDFVKQMSGEMNQWERSGQWLVSCFAPLKAHLPLTGFSDHSPEELRIKAYEALKTNTSNSYQAHWTELQQRYKQLRDALKMPTQEAVHAMREVFHAKSSLEQQEQQQQPVKQTSLFGKPPGQTVFGVSSPQPGSGAGLLGAKPQASIFGGSSTVFGGSQPTTTSVFGGGANKPVFGGQPTLGAQNSSPFVNQTPSIFGGASSNVFKGGAQNSTSTGLFGSPSQGQTHSGSIFGGSSTSTATGQTTSLFGSGQNQSTGSSVFNSNTQNQPSVFGGTAANAQSNVFQGAQGTAQTAASHTGGGQGIFGSQQQGLFGVQPVQQQQQQQSTSSVFGRQSIFGSSQATPATGDSVQNTSPSIFGGPSSSVFGGSAPKGTGSIFGGNTATGRGNGIFCNVPTAGPFSKPPGPFGNTSEPNSNPGLFGKPAEGAQPTTGQGPPGFGRPAEGTQSHMHSAISKNNPEWYTPLDQLQLEDRAQFEAEAFTTIPSCPPPQELCV